MARGTEFTLDGSGEPREPDGGKPTGDSGGVGAIDPTTLGGSGNDGSNSANGSGKRGRGRPKGSGTKSQTASPQLDIGSIETLLFNIHGLLAVATKIDQLALQQEEAKTLAVAVANVQKFYPMHISAKAFAWTNLVMVAGSVYGSRAVSIWADMKAAENARDNPPVNNGNVTALRT